MKNCAAVRKMPAEMGVSSNKTRMKNKFGSLYYYFIDKRPKVVMTGTRTWEQLPVEIILVLKYFDYFDVLL